MQKIKGISLIVLVITIIVMIILAGSIILSLNNNGIIGKASEAVEGMDNAQIKQLAQLGWADAYAQYGANLEELKKGVNTALTNNGLNLDEYGIKVTTSGVEIVKGWIQDGLVVRKGDNEIDIGDNVAYDETAKNTVEVPNNVKWQVLGANDKGELLILSSEYVDEIDSWGESVEERKNAWLNCVQILDSKCKIYGNGKNATGARSITLDDVNKITGYTNKVSETIITFDGTTAPLYKYENEQEKRMAAHDNGFYYYDGTSIVEADLEKLSGNKITIKNTGEDYKLSDTLDKDSNAYKMLYKEMPYYLATPWVGAGSTINFGVHNMNNMGVDASCYWIGGTIYNVSIFNSMGLNEIFGGLLGQDIRAVVSLKAETNIKEMTADGWSYE